MTTFPSEKRKILDQALASLSKDPLSVQFLGPWFWSLLPGHSPLADALPWLTFGAIRWLKSYLRPQMAVFEWGSGGSTVFFAERVRSVVSIESDPQWQERVSRTLGDRRISNADLRLIPAEPPPSLHCIPDGPTAFTSPERPGFSFEAYVRSIEAFADGSFDLVSIDGYARASCVSRAIPKVRAGGYLLFDNSDWDISREAVALLARFPRVDFRGVGPFQPTGWQTSIWRL